MNFGFYHYFKKQWTHIYWKFAIFNWENFFQMFLHAYFGPLNTLKKKILKKTYLGKLFIVLQS